MRQNLKYIKHPGSYRKRAAIFWAVLSLLFIVIILWLLWPFSGKPKQLDIRAGICGEVNIPAVYTLPEGADLAMLIRRAHGLTYRADIRNIDPAKKIMHDTIYHIPGRYISRESITDLKSLSETLTTTVSDHKLDDLAKEFSQEEIKEVNILYAGIPAMYVIINYYPQLNQINLVHIPHATVFTGQRHRLVDLFLTLGPLPTMRVMEKQLGIKMDHYIIQDRFSFIEMIDQLKGVTIHIDDHFAESYGLNSGDIHIGGFHAWEYIRFLDFRRLHRQFTGERPVDLIISDPFRVEPSQWQQAFEERHHRQRRVLDAMLVSFNQMSTAEQLVSTNEIYKTLETSLTLSFILNFHDAGGLKIPRYGYGGIPGNYAGDDDGTYFYPDIPSFDQLRNQMIREYLVRKVEEGRPAY